MTNFIYDNVKNSKDTWKNSHSWHALCNLTTRTLIHIKKETRYAFFTLRISRINLKKLGSGSQKITSVHYHQILQISKIAYRYIILWASRILDLLHQRKYSLLATIISFWAFSTSTIGCGLVVIVICSWINQTFVYQGLNSFTVHAEEINKWIRICLRLNSHVLIKLCQREKLQDMVLRSMSF